VGPVLGPKFHVQSPVHPVDKVDERLWRGSRHLDTKFSLLQFGIYRTITAEVNISCDTAHEKLGLFARLKKKNTESPLSPPTSPRSPVTRPLTPQEKIFTFVQLIKYLQENHKISLFDPDTISKILKKFDNKDVEIADVQAVLVANGSEIPNFTSMLSISGDSPLLNYGDLAIMVESLCGDRRVFDLFVIPNDV
ncbi:MAG: hypothetical protein IKE41_04210, partial [Clostridia bacterium]|nr:hypothetical protein [Clostridia bacterium]